MLSIQIKDYIIAGLLVALLLSGLSVGYYKTSNGIMSEKLDNVKLMAEEAERKTKLIEKRAEQERSEADEQYKSDITSLNFELDRMRDSHASILPAAPKAARNSNEASFDREKLDRAIQEYRAEIQRLIGQGAACEIEVKTLQNWWYNVQSLYQ